MKIKGILTNKYTLLVLFLLALLITDMLTHKGITKVMLGSVFTNIIGENLPRCDHPLVMTGKNWRKGINTVEKFNQLEPGTEGFEMDVYFDTLKDCLEVYHDTSFYSSLKITSLLDLYRSRKLTASVWLDFKNLSASNARQALSYIIGLRKNYGLKNKLIIESSAPASLVAFCDNGFFTSYYVPFFNPYRVTKSDLKMELLNIRNNLVKYPASAVSGYYFQYPVLKNNFPNYPLLTWASSPGSSFVANLFHSRLQNDKAVKIILYP